MLECTNNYNMTEEEVVKFASQELYLSNDEITRLKNEYVKSSDVEFKDFINYLGGNATMHDDRQHRKVIKEAYKNTAIGIDLDLFDMKIRKMIDRTKRVLF